MRITPKSAVKVVGKLAAEHLPVPKAGMRLMASVQTAGWVRAPNVVPWLAAPGFLALILDVAHARSRVKLSGCTLSESLV